jgi:hypothetical protein
MEQERMQQQVMEEERAVSGKSAINHGHGRHASGRDVWRIDASRSFKESAVNFKHGRNANGQDVRHVDGQRDGSYEDEQ